MSDIRGEGYGSSHNWHHHLTDRFNGDMGTRYLCLGCGACFVHMYNWQPDIFEAMRGEGIAEVCVPIEAAS